MRTIACVGCLTPGGSIHTDTFLRAVSLARPLLPEDCTLMMIDDRADAPGGQAAARQAIQAGVQAVVGHFASASAQAAAPRYAQHNIPLLLPAATHRDLTRHATTWRLCDSDEAYVLWLARQLHQRSWQPVRAVSDGSAHGDSVVQQLQHYLPPVHGTPPVTLFAGRYAEAVRFCGAWAAAQPEGVLILTDDAWSPALVPHLLHHGVDPARHAIFVAAIRPDPQTVQAQPLRDQWQQQWAEPVGCYFWETVAALQLAAAWPAAATPTVLGTLTFDEHREARPHHMGLWRVTPDGLHLTGGERHAVSA